MATITPRGQRGITLIEIVLWCAIVAAAVVAVFVFGKKASVTAAVETEQRQVEDIVKTVDAIFATQPNFAALGTNGAVYLRERAARSGLKFQTNDDGGAILSTGLGNGVLTLSSWDAVPPSGPAIPNSGYRLAYQGLPASECSKLVTATYPIAYQVSAGNDGLNDAAATNLATRGQMTVSPAVIAENCAAADGDATVFLYFYPARAIAAATTPSPPPAARCNPVHETQNVACPAGQSGTVTQERDGTCTGPGNSMVYTVWTTTGDTCQDPATPPPTVTPPASPDDCAINTYTQVLACSTAGQIGQVVQSRNHDTCAGTYTPWTTISDSCQPQPPTGTCTPSTQQQPIACPAGQGGQIVQTRSSSCTTPTSVPTWSPWTTVSSTCTAGCVSAGTCCTPIPEERPVPCPAGTYGAGGREVRFLGCVNATTQSTTWSAWQPYRDLEPSAGCTACPATSTETNTRWVTQSTPCPTGEDGTHTWKAEQVRTRTVSYSCPAGTTTLPAPTTSAWSSWTFTGAVNDEVNTCKPATCSGASSETQWLGTSAACPSGQTGTNTWEYEQTRSRTCNAGTWSTWGGWTSTGATRNVVNTCASNACTPVYSSEPDRIQDGNYGPYEFYEVTINGAIMPDGIVYCQGTVDCSTFTAPDFDLWSSMCKDGDTFIYRHFPHTPDYAVEETDIWTCKRGGTSCPSGSWSMIGLGGGPESSCTGIDRWSYSVTLNGNGLSCTAEIDGSHTCFGTPPAFDQWGVCNIGDEYAVSSCDGNPSGGTIYYENWKCF